MLFRLKIETTTPIHREKKVDSKKGSLLFAGVAFSIEGAIAREAVVVRGERIVHSIRSATVPNFINMDDLFQKKMIRFVRSVFLLFAFTVNVLT